VRASNRIAKFMSRMGGSLFRMRVMRAAADHRMKCNAHGRQPSESFSHGFWNLAPPNAEAILLASKIVYLQSTIDRIGAKCHSAGPY
jgi:hypothetical protein